MTDKQFDLAMMKKVGMIQQKQKEYFAMRLRAVGGDLTAKQLKKIAEIAEKYGKGQVHLSTRQGVEIHHVHNTNLEKARIELEKVDVRMGACGPRVRVIVACPGNATCKWGVIETKEVAKDLDKNYFREDTPHKFKMSVTGCPNNCAKATENDVGVMGGIVPKWIEEDCIDCDLCVTVCPTNAISKKGKKYILDKKKCIYCPICITLCPTNAWIEDKKGYSIFIGGTMGKIPRLGTRIKDFIQDKKELYQLTEKALKYYQKHGKKKERFGHMIDRIGVEKVKKEILNGV
ncbi:4Fe-4S dicluster domain-containing protein [Candidatus Margulisiibacteriota bacterium]